MHMRVVQYPLMQAFVAPVAQVSCVRRVNSSVAPQALALLNDPFVRLRAKELARRVASEAGGDVDTRIRLAFLLTLARHPDAEELAEARSFVLKQHELRRQRDNKPAPASVERDAWADLCQTLLGLNEFIYVD
jgi:hypothetical protein